MKEISTSSAEDKEEAKKIFFEYSCNHVEMARNDVYFSKYHISKEQEAEWRNEFITYWRSRLSTEDLTAVQKLEEAHAVESIPDLIAMIDQGDSYANLRIAQALLSLGDWLGRDETLRTQTRATALKTVQSILDHPVQLSDRHKSDIERLGDFDPEDYVITLALVHKSKTGDNPSIWRQELGNQITFGHAQMGHAVECQTTGKSLCGLGFQQTSRKLVAKDGFQSEHNRFC